MLEEVVTSLPATFFGNTIQTFLLEVAEFSVYRNIRALEKWMFPSFSGLL